MEKTMYSNRDVKQLRGLTLWANYTDRVTANVGGQRNGSPWLYSRFSKPKPLLFLTSSSSIVLTKLSGPRSRPPLLRKSGSAGNITRDLWICSQELWPLDHRGGPIGVSPHKLRDRYKWFCLVIKCISFLNVPIYLIKNTHLKFMGHITASFKIQ
jgi:hypothetical protein